MVSAGYPRVGKYALTTYYPVYKEFQENFTGLRPQPRVAKAGGNGEASEYARATIT